MCIRDRFCERRKRIEEVIGVVAQPVPTSGPSEGERRGRLAKTFAARQRDFLGASKGEPAPRRG
eukprot:4953641-Alexandrium_andersonii.AAC.1